MRARSKTSAEGFSSLAFLFWLVGAFKVPLNETELAFDFLHTFEKVFFASSYMYASKEYPNPFMVLTASPARQDSKRSLLNDYCGDSDILSTQPVKVAFQRWKSFLFPEKIEILIHCNWPCISWFSAPWLVSGLLKEQCNLRGLGSNVFTKCNMWLELSDWISCWSDSMVDFCDVLFSCCRCWLTVDLSCCKGSRWKPSVSAFSRPNSSWISSSNSCHPLFISSFTAWSSFSWCCSS